MKTFRQFIDIIENWSGEEAKAKERMLLNLGYNKRETTKGDYAIQHPMNKTHHYISYKDGKLEYFGPKGSRPKLDIE